MEPRAYRCTRCNGTEFDTDEIRTTGNGLSRFFDVQNRKFTVVACRACGYCELYRRKSSTAGNVLDFLVGS
ncbi:MAG: zinc ribbon domain-containing protein [Candidatus Cloacimonetes bacterium]|nr:zinc ribbon domain-containing protein [Candidatus Cloacimonadota bacterium]MCA9785797.1 zinc ribbon domain-containing protein [Candidatus Cloacimonadota bacterium]